MSKEQIEETKDIFELLNEGLYVQESSTYIMKFLIQDLRDYA